MDNKMKIVDFYKDQEIFITGGLGFMGKVLIEKLLRSCPDLKRIFVLIRSRKNESAQQRLEEMIQSPLFDLLKSQNSSALSKLTAVEGDISIDDLGINSKDFELIQNVSIIFHSAASTKFNELFAKIVMINVNGIYNVMLLAEKLHNIKVVLHISTAFCNLDQNVIEEKVYPCYGDWREILELSKNAKHDKLKEYVEKVREGTHHNNYTISKQLCEQVIYDYKDKFPIVLMRPSVVVNMVAEPLPGWTDSLSGPIALAVGYGTGVIRTIHADPNGIVEMTPVDVSIKAIIVAAFKKGTSERDNKITVYNISQPIHKKLFEKLGVRCVKENPFEKCLWNPSKSSTKCYYYFLLNFLLFQIIPAVIVDSLLFLAGQKTFLLKVQKKIFTLSKAYGPFALKTTNIVTTNLYHLDRLVSSDEFETFAFMQYSYNPDHYEHTRTTVQYIRKNILNEPLESTKSAKIKAKIFLIVDSLIKIFFYYYLIRWILRLENVKYFFDYLFI